MYDNGAWEEYYSTYEDGSDTPVEFNASGDMVLPYMPGVLAFGVKSQVDLSGQNIAALDTIDDLRYFIFPDAVFGQGSVGYLPKLAVVREVYDFQLGSRSCQRAEAVPDNTGRMTCPADTWNNWNEYQGSIAQMLVSLNSLESARRESLTNLGYYFFHFVDGTHELAIYQEYSYPDYDILEPPVLLTEKGSWTELILGGKIVMELTFPVLPGAYGISSNQKLVFLQNDSVVISGIHYIPGEVIDDEMFNVVSWINEPAMNSILNAFQPPAVLTKRTAPGPTAARNKQKQMTLFGIRM
jgi:hypothetical protein